MSNAERCTATVRQWQIYLHTEVGLSTDNNRECWNHAETQRLQGGNVGATLSDHLPLTSYQWLLLQFHMCSGDLQLNGTWWLGFQIKTQQQLVTNHLVSCRTLYGRTSDSALRWDKTCMTNQCDRLTEKHKHGLLVKLWLSALWKCINTRVCVWIDEAVCSSRGVQCTLDIVLEIGTTDIAKAIGAFGTLPYINAWVENGCRTNLCYLAFSGKQ